MKRLFAFSTLALVLALTPAALADEAIRATQIILKEGGFYTGALDGDFGPRTREALRRYQIYNHLRVAGTLTPETVNALNRESSATKVPPPSDERPPVSGPDRPEADYGRIFAGTPFSDAPRGAQVTTLRRAQSILARRGFYDGPVHGVPNPPTRDALLRFQAVRDLPRTGTLNVPTLAELDLLPSGPRPPLPPPPLPPFP